MSQESLDILNWWLVKQAVKEGRCLVKEKLRACLQELVIASRTGTWRYEVYSREVQMSCLWLLCPDHTWRLCILVMLSTEWTISVLILGMGNVWKSTYGSHFDKNITGTERTGIRGIGLPTLHGAALHKEYLLVSCMILNASQGTWENRCHQVFNESDICRTIDSSHGLPGGSVVKHLPTNVGVLGSIPELGRSPGDGNGTPLQDSCLGNLMDRGAWWATVCGVAKELDLTQWLNNNNLSLQPSTCLLPLPLDSALTRDVAHKPCLVLLGPPWTQS